MRVLMFDIDTLRADHMGCYGYKRDTTPVIDSVAKEGVCFDQFYCPNAPCLPSRASLVSGRYGIHNGIVGHGGTAADMRLQGASRSFTDLFSENSLFMQFRRAGMETVSFSTFAERHSAWWFNSGFNQCINVGNRGGESAEKVTPKVLEWLEQNGTNDNWMLHIHYWDPHTPYRTPQDYHPPFENDPLPDNWIDSAIFEEHRMHVGPHCANEINMWNDDSISQFPKHPGRIDDLAGAANFMNQYDAGIRYTDDNIGQILSLVKQLGLYDEELAIIITADHGEDIGEFGIYGEHGTADECVCRIPLIIKWPGCQKDKHVSGFYDNTDIAPTMQELLGVAMAGNYTYDGRSLAPALLGKKDNPRTACFLTQCAHVCQRSVRFGDYLYMRTIHGGYHLFPREMLFDLKQDPHEQHNIADERPELCEKGARLILNWTEDMMRTSDSDADPMWTVMREGGPEHCRGRLLSYAQRLRDSGRTEGADALLKHYADELLDET